MIRRTTHLALTNPPTNATCIGEADMEWMREQGSPTRRTIVASAAAGVGALLAGKLAWAQAARSPGRIDLHQHYFPPVFLDAQRDAAVRQNRSTALGTALEGWSKARMIEAMDRDGI